MCAAPMCATLITWSATSRIGWHGWESGTYSPFRVLKVLSVTITMNFLLRSSEAIVYELPTVALTVEKDPQASEATGSCRGGLPFPGGLEHGGGEDGRLVASSTKMRTRMAIEDHADVPTEGGTIIVPFKALAEDWSSTSSVACLLPLDRPFIFPGRTQLKEALESGALCGTDFIYISAFAGERFQIIIYVSVHHSEMSSVITPYKVAAAVQHLPHTLHDTSNYKQDMANSSHNTAQQDSMNIKTSTSVKNVLKGKWFNTTEGGNLVATTEGLEVGKNEVLSESGKRRNKILLESFKNSHFLVKIGRKGCRPDKQAVGCKREQSECIDDEVLDKEKVATAHGCKPVIMEDGHFESKGVGGVAREATACCSLENGDVVVLLQVTMASEIISHSAELEVLQFELYISPQAYPVHVDSQLLLENRTESLLQWLLPLDRPSSPPPAAATLPQPALAPSPSGRMSFSGTGNSTFFSFSHARNSSLGSMPTPAPTTVVLHTPPPAPSYGRHEWGKFSTVKELQKDVGSEGLLSFRGAAVEPQRFSANCGLSGPYIPGKRWKRTMAILQPVRLVSYFADCNTQDLICVLIENILPPAGETADVVIYIDSVSIICQSASPGSSLLPIPIACVEVGEDHSLPSLTLRPGEQHSFILRPINQLWNQPSLENTSAGNLLLLDTQKPNGTRQTGGQSRTADIDELDCGVYAVLVSCHCSHTESRLHFKHSLSWRPRSPCDLLLSMALEKSSPVKLPLDALPKLAPQVVSVQVTNLTSQDMYLTLLAPSSLAGSPLSVLPMTSNEAPVVSKATGNHQLLRVTEDLVVENERAKAMSDSKLSSQRLSLPPVQPMEMVLGVKPLVLKERIFSSSDTSMDSGIARTHLWLQSTVPLGRLPPHATTAVRCELLPLTDGNITLDTLHIASNKHDVLYIPENSLEIYCMSSIASSVL